MAIVRVLFARSDCDRGIARDSAADVADALTVFGHDVSLVPLESTTEYQLRGADLIFPCDSFPCPAWALRRDAGASFAGIKAFLESEKIPYVGSSPLAVRWCKSKLLTKVRLAECGILAPSDVSEDETRSERFFPLIVKPDRGGGSRGVTLVESAVDLPRAIEAARAVTPGDVILERYVAGTEVTVAILEVGAAAVVMEPLEILLLGRILDARAKTTRPYPAIRPLRATSVRARVASAALAAFRALRCAGLARIDMRIDRAGVAWIVDVNVSPRLSRNEYFAMSAKRNGIPYEELIARLVRSSIGRFG